MLNFYHWWYVNPAGLFGTLSHEGVLPPAAGLQIASSKSYFYLVAQKWPKLLKSPGAVDLRPGLPPERAPSLG